ncbi:glycerol-3-phosphate 1-O-acyltransferase PlsY [Candidatus Pelagibacter sp.]|nr:glycerol-3-phosphate 1-O-acyltransferase PlsY [Candidatus Pelagibacter sp.]
MLNLEITFIIIISYLFGSIPFGLILTKTFIGKDIRKIGSGNIGATNVLRSGNKFIGYLTLTLDILKAVVPILIVNFFYNDQLYLASLSIFIGHVFPVWLKFKGGKGVATYVGILFCLNYLSGIVFCVTWLLIFFIFKYSSLSSIVSSLCIPIFKYFFISDPFYYFYFIMFIMIFYTHRDNIKRLINKTESKTKIY